MSTETDERLTRIEERIAHIEALVESFHRTVTPFIENPGKLLGKIMGGR